MVYKTGFTSNSHMMVHVIKAAMEEAGWEVIYSDLGGAEYVLHSTGASGNENIYVRMAAGLYDKITHGDVQFYSSDGYNGFVNLFAYQHVETALIDSEREEDGYRWDGYSEIGRLGPGWYFTTANEKPIKFYNLLNNVLMEEVDGYVSVVNTVTSGSYNSYGRNASPSDGRGKLFIDSNDHLIKYSLGSVPVTASYINTDFFGAGETAENCTVFARRSAREPMLWAATQGESWQVGGWFTYNTLTGAIVKGSDAFVYRKHPWSPDEATDGWLIQGPRRNGSMYLYMAQGSGTKNWARYDILNNEWEEMSPALPNNTWYSGAGVYIMKEWTGYEYDRIYAWSYYGENFFSLAVDDNGDPVEDAIWIQHDPLNLYSGDYGGERMWFIGGNRIFAFNADDSPTYKHLYYFKFPDEPTDAGVWETDDNWFKDTTMRRAFGGTHGWTVASAAAFPQNHMLSRVEVDEGASTEYWVFANQDRVIVLTESYQSSYSSKQNLAYAGLFESTYDREFTYLTEDSEVCAPGELFVNDNSIFKIGTEYQLVANDGYLKESFNGEVFPTGKASRVTITGVGEDGCIYINEHPHYNFPSGSRIGQDPQPVGVYLQGMDKIQVLTNKALQDKNNTGDPSFQLYNIGFSSADFVTNAERIKDAMAVSPVIISASEVSGFVGPEVRGRLTGMYYCGTLASGSTLYIDGQQYKVFSIFESDKLTSVAIGPLE